MKINKGIVKNINKKLISGVLALTLLTTGLTGCASIEDINHTRNEQGYIQGIDGFVSYKFLAQCNFYKVTNNAMQKEYYTIGLNEGGYRYDIFTKQQINEEDLFECIFIDGVVDYLNAFGTVKEEYTEDDLKDILNRFIETQEKEDNKQLVKEK